MSGELTAFKSSLSIGAFLLFFALTTKILKPDSINLFENSVALLLFLKLVFSFSIRSSKINNLN